LTQLALYLHTLRYLRPVQLRGQLLMRLRAMSRARLPRLPRLPRQEPATRPGLAAIAFLPPARGLVSADGRFTFLNATGAAHADGVDWAARGMSRLWRYNLHYFDYLLDESLADDFRAALIDDWISHNPPGSADAWDAYPLSLRIVNWVKYFLSRPERPPPRHWLASLFSQAEWLGRNFEFHLLGNHLLKNAVALVFAGCFFEGREANAWLRRGWHCFVSEVLEQFLPDGGHYERSPMYHALCLADCLDVLSLTAQAPIAVHVTPAAALSARVRSAATFLRDICCPDGEIPLFNDSAFGIAPAPRALFARAQRLLGADTDGAFTRQPPRCELIDKRHSGYFGFRHGRDWLLVDCGPVGPDYQPGHAHCDTLSYELALDGARLIVDGGVYDYEAGAQRLLSRTTASHNTVMIDGCEQSEIWGAFRVARRARPLSAALQAAGPGCSFEGVHDGYRRLAGKPLHRRRIRYDGAGVTEVVDEICGRGTHTVASRIRLHPGYTPVIYASYAAVSGPDGQPVVRIEFADGVRPQLEAGWYFPQFGIQLACSVLVLQQSGRLPLHLGYRIVKARSS
jgi:uncharacterized heparinase superfamily protein